MTTINEALDAYAVALEDDARTRMEHQLTQALPNLPHRGDSTVCPCVDAFNRATDARAELWSAINRELEDMPPATPEVVQRLSHAIQRIRVLEDALDEANDLRAQHGLHLIEAAS